MKSIKTKLILSFSTIILAVTIIIGFISLQSGMESLKKEAKNSLQNLATEGAKLTESRMSSSTLILNIVAKRQEVRNMGWDVNLSLLEEELEKTDFLDIGYVLPNGYAHYASGSVVLMSDRNYVKSALKGEAKVSDIIFSRVSNQPEIEICVPVILDGEVVGAIIGRENAEFLCSITSDIGYGKNGYATIINGAGIIIAHPDASQILTNANVFDTILNDQQGVTDYHEAGYSMYAGYAPIKGTDWLFIITADKQEILEAIPLMVRNIVVAMFIVFLISILIVYFLDHTLTKPLIEMTKQSERIARLDISLDMKNKYLKQRDEIGILSRAFQQITLNLREILKELTESTNYIIATAQGLTANSQQSAAVAEEIVQTIETIANTAMNQACSTEEGLHQAAILGKVIEENEQLITTLNLASSKVTREVEKGLIEINQLSKSTMKNELATIEIGKIILETSKSSEQIVNASKLISKMAKQINLLSLNASIEAARAGEAGQGFAIVAKEILMMAEQSATSSRYIEDVIRQLKDNVEKAVKSMDEMEHTSKEQQKSVAETIIKYNSIADSMHASEKAVLALNNTKQEMSLAKNEIGALLDMIALIAKQNEVSTKQATLSMQDQSHFAQDIASTSEKLESLAIHLQEMVMKFHV